DKGDAGVVGVQGLPGTTGTPGKPGSGLPGAPGAGVTIVTNDSGTYVYNPTTEIYTRINGPKGDKGDAGVVGVQGLPGTTGTPGKPGSGLPGAPGAGVTIVTNDSGTYVYNPTTEIYTRINGPKGDAGAAGATGSNGAVGATGLTGATGPMGATGTAGIGGASKAGTGINITGTGSAADPYIINNTVVNTDNQTITDFSVDAATKILTLTLERGNTKTIDLTSLTNTTSNNGLTKTGINTQLGGALIKATTIATGGVNTLSITGLPAGLIGDELITRNAAGSLRSLSPIAFLPLFTADNGLTANVPGNTQLGGTLIQKTIITTSALNTLALSGLQPGAAIDKAVVADVNGVLKLVDQGPGQLKSFLNYQGSTAPSLLTLTLLGGYRAITFPAAGKQFDENNEYNSTTGIFTAKQAGIYSVFVQADSRGLVSAAEFGVGIFKIPSASNTPTLIAEERFLSVNVNLVVNLDVSPPTRSTETLVKLNAGDKIQFGLKLPLITLNLLGSTQTYFTIHQVK
ncbi:hypothetical protein ACVWYG_001889, partial [Pedobacter sp. UYEF25]